MSDINARWGCQIDENGYFVAQAQKFTVDIWEESIPPNGMYKAQLVDGVWIDTGTAPLTPLAQVQEAIDAERDRRISAGVPFNGVLYQSRDSDRENIRICPAGVHGHSNGRATWRFALVRFGV